MRGLSKKFSTYPRELLFVLRQWCRLVTCGVLLKNTALFHVGNAFGRRSGSDLLFAARLHFGVGHSAEIVINASCNSPCAGFLRILTTNTHRIALN